MPNYYEIIQVEPNATNAEIETAIDARYNQTRALVTHHDDAVRDQANQSLRKLEQIRATLIDPAKREVYDQTIGVKGATAGVVDPTAVINVSRTTMTAPPPPRPSSQKNAAQEASNSKLWTCQKCGEKNPEHTQYCYNCGTQLVRECPKCHRNTSLVSTGFCGNCGANYDEANERIKLRGELTQDLDQHVNQQNALTTEASTLAAESKTVAERRHYDSLAGIGLLVLLVSSIPVLMGTSSPGSVAWLLFGIVMIIVGAAFIYQGIAVARNFKTKRDAEVKNLQEQALAKTNQAKALETPISNLQMRIKELAD